MKQSATDKKIKFYIALQGDKKPKEYIRLAKLIEKIGFDRIYVYDDLMFYSSSQILTLIAEHTNSIEIGPCLLNGVYRHPAIIAQEAAFLAEIAQNRTILGMGRGAFFDFYGLDDSEKHTRKVAKETILQVKRLLNNEQTVLNGEFFNASPKAFLRVENKTQIPIVVGTWNKEMTKIAGELAHELQIANVWKPEYLQSLYDNLNLESPKKFSIGGMSCISYDKEKAYNTAKNTVAIYIPYLKTLLENQGFDTNSPYFEQLFSLSKTGKYAEAAEMLTHEVIDSISLVGTPEMIVEKIRKLQIKFDIEGIMISPPYGTGTFEEDLELIMEKIVKVLN